MSNKISLKDTDIAAFEEKVYTIADEVLVILKELSKENKKQISSKLIAEKMFRKESVKNALVNNDGSPDDSEADSLKDAANAVLDKFADLIPSYTEKFSSLKDTFNDKNILKNPADWLDSPIGVTKKYINSISSKNKDLETFLKQTTQYLAVIEKPLSSELSSRQQNYKEDKEFGEGLEKYVNMMKHECNINNDIESLKMAFLNKLENINNSIEQKREQDIMRLKDAEKTLGEMWERMNEIKGEADEIRRRSQEMEFESYHDALTGLYNRRAYEDKISETLANLERYNVPASLMICDIDFFKKINDTFGHKVGDLALKKLASLLRERLRKNDFISRYGGEEFAVILPHTDINGAITAGEGLRSFIDKSVFSYHDQRIPLTISVGVSYFRKGDDAGSVFERADSALYLAKNSGRNKVKTENDVIIEGTTLNKGVVG
ncbi:MAG: diguanylate cyclase [Nitrospirae bacterium]|nr:diguanylate cyclase [Nitrospirota bacterium]